MQLAKERGVFMEPRGILEGRERIRAHTVHIDSRQLVSITGVKDVISFNEQEVLLLTEGGELCIAGEELHITKLNLDDGVVAPEGEIAALDYDDAPEAKGSLFKRMFR